MTEHVVIEKRVHERLLRRSKGLTKTRILCAAMIVLFSALLLLLSWHRGAMKANKPPVPAPVIRVL